VRVNVRLFAMVRERVGKGEISLELPVGATVARAAMELEKAYPGMGEQMKRAGFAVNREYVSVEMVLEDGDELAVIPPVSGG
jgi:molybdopterin converting factor subunit 1